MRKHIAVSREVREKIAKTFRVTDRTVRNALNLEYPATDIIKRIRKMAKENGGVMMATIPAGEAIYFADGTMRMDFDNGAYCEFYREDSRGEIWYRDDLIETRLNVSVPEIFHMKEKAAKL